MAKYKIGDKVRVRTDLVVGKRYYMEGDVDVRDCFSQSMEIMKGKIVTIKDIYNGKYYIKEFDCYWTDEMFEPVNPSTTTTEKEETKMKIKNIKVIDSRVVIVEFSNGDTQKAVCMPGDTFDFGKGVEVCVMKHLLGKSAYYKALKDADKQIKALNMAAEKANADAELRARKEAKEARRKAARAERKRAARVAEMKEAYLSALKEYNGDADKVIEAVK